MMKTKITVTFSDGRRRVLKAPIELNKIEKSREATFIMDNLEIFHGYCDGDIDEDGDFAIMRNRHTIGLPFNRLLGWCYT